MQATRNGRWRVRIARCLAVVLPVVVPVVPVAPPPAAAAAALHIAAGYYHNCRLAAGVASCWGLDGYGQLGDGASADESHVVPVSTGGALFRVRLTAIATGGAHTCVLADTGAAYCWGRNNSGQLGDGTTTDRNSPVAVAGGVQFRTLALGNAFSCGLSTNALMYCWGRNTNGELGDGTVTERHTPVRVGVGSAFGHVSVAGIGVGGLHACALSSTGRAYCWGANADGQLGNGTASDRSTPVAVDTGGALRGVALTQLGPGVYHTCALSRAGSAYCWGYNGSGQVGDGTTTNRFHPVPVYTGGVLSGRRLIGISGGYGHTCAVSGAGGGYCWGANADGELGDGTTDDRHTPVALNAGGLPAGTVLTQVAAGASHTCAASSAARAYCWGGNTSGQVGDRTTATRTVPVAVLGPMVAPHPPTAVTVAAHHAALDVSWTAPSDTGSAPLAGYTATAQPGGAQCASPGPPSCTIAGLTDGTVYTVTVVATSPDGTSRASDPTEPVTPGVPPGAPTDVVISPQDASLAVSWTTPADLGSSSLTGYTATASPGGATCSTPGTTTCVIGGLTNGWTYTVTVVGQSAAGLSPASVASNTATPGFPALPDTVPRADAPLVSSVGVTFSNTARDATVTGSGFAPDTPVLIGIYSAPTTLTVANSDDSGNVVADITIPAGYRGTHTIVARGYVTGGGIRTLSLQVTVSRTIQAGAGLVLGAIAGAGFALMIAGVIMLIVVRRRQRRAPGLVHAGH